MGGTLADRLGYKPLIVAGCLLRTGGFALLVVAQSLPAVLIAAAATGFAGALFNPAVRAYLAGDAGDRRVEAFAMFNLFYQAGICWVRWSDWSWWPLTFRSRRRQRRPFSQC
uniref:MFS transporter n=1 Tax=Mycobacterium timonense TaxID=701043 RepID=UPI00142EA0E7|nr:MFS transporter [Mycobacterium timonense]